VIHLIRHGATDQPLLRPPGDLTPATPEEWLQDFGLDDRGRSEARALGVWLAKLPPPDRLLSSPKRRTQETAALAAPGWRAELTDDLHEWHGDEPSRALLAGARRLVAQGEEEALWCFTHGGFIRAVLAALIIGPDDAAFDATFHGLRRSLHVWNASLTVIGHGPSGLEIVSVNQAPAIDAMLQK
jgi:broad specificity phosphatase PhoE